MSVRLELRLGEYVDRVGERLASWGREDVLRRIWDKDHTVWSAEPVPELTDRLGWLDLPERLGGVIPDLTAFRDELLADGIEHVVVLGMGGSSLAPEVFFKTFGGSPELRVLDSTHPGAVVGLENQIDLAKAVFIVASKSGTTIEPLSFMEYFWAKVADVSDRPGRHFVATTDPGSKLQGIAEDRGFRRVFLAPPQVGGRYSALTEFGMVPAAAIGADLVAIQASAMTEQRQHGPEAMVATAAGCRLGAAMGELALAGRDKVTFVTSADLAAMPAWIEQLIAESTGKNGQGIVPIGGEPVGRADAYGGDRMFVVLGTTQSAPIDEAQFGHHPVAVMTLDSVTDIGAAMYIFEMATALAGKALGIQPFDQPDVQLAKELARDAMAGTLDLSGVVELDAMADDLASHVSEWLDGATAGDYVGINAFIQPTAEAASMLAEARLAIRNGKRVATTLDFGPRFLHSTGQLHKGGPNTGLFLVLIDHASPNVPVPTTDYDFTKLVTAQSLGDHLALQQRGRRVLLVCLGDDGMEALQRVVEVVEGAAA